jgi:hypothetical protein
LGIEIVATIELAQESMRCGGAPLALPVLADRAAA